MTTNLDTNLIDTLKTIMRLDNLPATPTTHSTRHALTCLHHAAQQLDTERTTNLTNPLWHAPCEALELSPFYRLAQHTKGTYVDRLGILELHAPTADFTRDTGELRRLSALTAYLLSGHLRPLGAHTTNFTFTLLSSIPEHPDADTIAEVSTYFIQRMKHTPVLLQLMDVPIDTIITFFFVMADILATSLNHTTTDGDLDYLLSELDFFLAAEQLPRYLWHFYLAPLEEQLSTTALHSLAPSMRDRVYGQTTQDITATLGRGDSADFALGLPVIALEAAHDILCSALTMQNLSPTSQDCDPSTFDPLMMFDQHFADFFNALPISPRSRGQATLTLEELGSLTMDQLSSPPCTRHRHKDQP